jgi:hypothetical protein
MVFGRPGSVMNRLHRCRRRRLLALAAGLALTGLAQAELRIQAGYSESADLYSLMDNVSLWSPEGFNDPEYREYWEETFGWSEADQAWADRYRAYRERSYSDPGQAEQDPAIARDGLFAKRSSFAETADPLAAHFIAADSVAAALAGLDGMASPDDAEMLAGFYAHFEDRWRVLLAESDGFAARAEALQAALSGPEVAAYLQRVSEFYGVDIDRDFNAFFVWWPPIDRTGADVGGRTFFIRSHPERHAGEGGWDEIAMHEVIHYISAHQPDAQKQALTARFLEVCPAQIATGFYQLLEEPLAVAFGNAAFAAFARGQALSPDANWYWMPTPSIMGRLLWDDVERIYPTDATINDGIIDQAAEYCRQILQISEWMSKAPAPASDPR